MLRPFGRARTRAALVVAAALATSFAPAPVTASASRASCAPDSLRCRVSVRDFGARGNGSSDDAPAIQRAIDSLPRSGGIVEVPAGTYRLLSSAGTVGRFPSSRGVASALIVRRDNVTLQGVGKSSILRLGASTKMRVLSITGSNVTVSDLSVDGDKIDRDGGKAYPDGDVVDALVYGASGSKDVTITRCWVHDGLEDGIGFWESVRPKVTGCSVWGNGTLTAKAQGIAVSGPKTRGARIVGNHVWGNSWAGLWVAFGASDALVSRNVLRDNDVAGIYVGDETPARTKRIARRLRVEDNTVSGNGLFGGELAAGLSVSGAVDGTVKHNRFHDNYLDGIVLRDEAATRPARWTIHRNECSNTTVTRNQDAGIRITSGSRAVSVRGNRCVDNGGHVDHQIVVQPGADVNRDWRLVNHRGYDPV